MSYSYKCYSDTKDFMKKFVNAEEGAIIYGISKSRNIINLMLCMRILEKIHMAFRAESDQE